MCARQRCHALISIFWSTQNLQFLNIVYRRARFCRAARCIGALLEGGKGLKIVLEYWEPVLCALCDAPPLRTRGSTKTQSGAWLGRAGGRTQPICELLTGVQTFKRMPGVFT